MAREHYHCWRPLEDPLGLNAVHRCCRCPDICLNSSGLEMEEKTHGGMSEERSVTWFAITRLCTSAATW